MPVYTTGRILHNLSTWLTLPVNCPTKKQSRLTHVQREIQVDRPAGPAEPQLTSADGRDSSPVTSRSITTVQRRHNPLHTTTHALVWESTVPWDGADIVIPSTQHVLWLGTCVHNYPH